MPIPVSLNGVTYFVPVQGDQHWAPPLTRYLVALASATLQPTGGTFTLTGDVNFGPSFGLLSKYFTSITTLPATAGAIRLAKTDTIDWRNNAGSGNNILSTDASDNLVWNGIIIPTGLASLADGKIWIGSAGNLPVAQTLTGDVTMSDVGLTAIGALKIVNAQISNSAAIAYSKLNLGTSIVNGDIGSSAAIVYSKLALSNSIVNADIATTAAIVYSKLALSNSIVNADIATTAAIDYSKLATLTASKVLVSDGSGVVSASTITTTTLGYLDASSSIQTQLNGKQASLTIGNLTDVGTDGITVTGGTGAVIGSGTSFAQHVADATHNGYLSSTDWSTFSGKQNTLTLGNLTDVGTDGITVTNGTGAVIGTGTSFAQHVADATHNGYLTSTDWSTFSGKQNAFSGLNTDGVLYATSATAVSSTAAGTTGQFLAANTGGAPTWGTPAGSGSVNSGTTPLLAFYAATGTAVSGVNADASMGSNKITNLKNGTGAQDAAAFGQIKYLQCVQGAPATSYTAVTSTSFVSATPTVTIVPTSASNRVKITLSTCGMQAPAGGYLIATIYRGASTNLGDATWGLLNYSGTSVSPGSFTIVDSPATTSSTTYTVYVKVSGPTGYWNTDMSSSGFAVIIAEEIV